MDTKNYITTEVVKQVKKIIRQEDAHLVGEALQESKDTSMPADARASYISGIQKLASNLQMLLDNAAGTENICWRCGNALETTDGHDFEGIPVKKCIECSAVIRD